MTTLKIAGHIDEQHRLCAEVPDSIPPGPVTVLIVTSSEEDAAGEAWAAGIAQEWLAELSDSRQDIYTLEDGEPLGES